MTFIEDIMGKLFPERQKKLSYKENFTQSPEEMYATAAWIESEEGKGALAKVYSNLHLKKVGINEKPTLHVLESPYANGFAVTYEPPFTTEIFQQLFFSFGRRMLALGYQRVSLDRKMEELQDSVKITEKLYFKPPLSAATIGQKIDQLFGNVTIEKVSLDDKPSFVKVLVTVYADHLYLPAKPFDDFVERLFNP
ncbi:MAG TPA: hypothetical protein VK957_14120 [Lunatimonas sp.]|nr:hypothetical protein [Lunatimonas sp.]